MSPLSTMYLVTCIWFRNIFFLPNRKTGLQHHFRHVIAVTAIKFGSRVMMNTFLLINPFWDASVTDGFLSQRVCDFTREGNTTVFFLYQEISYVDWNRINTEFVLIRFSNIERVTANVVKHYSVWQRNNDTIHKQDWYMSISYHKSCSLTMKIYGHFSPLYIYIYIYRERKRWSKLP